MCLAAPAGLLAPGGEDEVWSLSGPPAGPLPGSRLGKKYHLVDCRLWQLPGSGGTEGNSEAGHLHASRLPSL